MTTLKIVNVKLKKMPNTKIPNMKNILRKATYIVILEAKMKKKVATMRCWLLKNIVTSIDK